MTFNVAFDPDTFGLGLFWNAPLEIPEIHHILGTHMLCLIVFNFTFQLTWGD